MIATANLRPWFGCSYDMPAISARILRQRRHIGSTLPSAALITISHWPVGAKKAAFLSLTWRGAVCSGWRSEFSTRLWSKWLVANWTPLRGVQVQLLFASWVLTGSLLSALESAYLGQLFNPESLVRMNLIIFPGRALYLICQYIEHESNLINRCVLIKENSHDISISRLCLLDALTYRSIVLKNY